ncbi:uncharacterized protein TEOVI_000072500 [Trypanosoma equiperdum]|uniref:Uncharacterized protein n=1 Tax=Trypanosoma equiperdum TaxID=5694 RepID=A0A1G4IAR2_TRYEQ|nr:hypothetical protein, conserved [Trypanosoma equiperdum]
MSYRRPTASSQRRARNHSDTSELSQAESVKSAHGGKANFAFGSIFRECGKRLRGESPTECNDEMEVHLSQQLTKRCDAALERASTLLDKTIKESERNSQTLQDGMGSSSRRSSMSPKKPSSPDKMEGGVTSRGSARLSGTVLKAPPPTPEQTQRDESVANETRESGKWLEKLLGRVSNVVAKARTSPDMKERMLSEDADGGASAASTPHSSPCPLQRPSVGRASMNESTPSRLRKSVTFKDGANLETLTPPPRVPHIYEEEESNPEGNAGEEGGLAEAYMSTQLAGGPAFSSELPSQVTLQFSPAPRAPSRGSSCSRSVDMTNSPELPQTRDVGAVIRGRSSSEAYRELSKEELLLYVKQHHISVKKMTSKKELFEVGRRIAEEKTSRAD